LAATRTTLKKIRASDDETQRRILPVWEANLHRDEALPEKLTEECRRRIAGGTETSLSRSRLGTEVRGPNRGGGRRLASLLCTVDRHWAKPTSRRFPGKRHGRVPASAQAMPTVRINRSGGRPSFCDPIVDRR